MRTSRRKRTTEISIKHAQVTIKTPVTTPTETINKIIEDRKAWIIKNVKKYKKPDIMLSSYENNSILPYLGNQYHLTIIKDIKPAVQFPNEYEIIIKSNRGNSAKTIKKIYEIWLFDNAPKIFNPIIEKYSRLLNSKPKKILIKTLKSRWGSATSKGTINLNLHLIKAPQEVIECVVLHEISHLSVRNHSVTFWNLINQYMPNYKKHITWLRINGHNLLN